MIYGPSPGIPGGWTSGGLSFNFSGIEDPQGAEGKPVTVVFAGQPCRPMPQAVVKSELAGPEPGEDHMGSAIDSRWPARNKWARDFRMDAVSRAMVAATLRR